MSKNILISDLKAIAKKGGYDHVICFATADRRQFVATFGTTIEYCDQAAQFGDKLKDGLGWPKSLHAMPSRVKQFKNRAEKAEAEIERLRAVLGDIIFECGLAGMGKVDGLKITTMAQKALKGGEG